MADGRHFEKNVKSP